MKGKHVLLQNLHADAPELQRAVDSLAVDYKAAPILVGYQPPRVADVQDALDGVARARARFPRQVVRIQTDLGDVELPDAFPAPMDIAIDPDACTVVVNRGHEYLKVKSADMLGQSQWTIMRNGRATKVEILHKSWLEAYQSRTTPILPGDSLECSFEETITYDDNQNEIERKLYVIEVIRVVTPPMQVPLL